MIFAEKKYPVPIQEMGFAAAFNFEYAVEDVFGRIEVRSFDKLEAKTLDDIVLYVLKSGAGKGEIVIAGEGIYKGQNVSVGTFTFKKNLDWLKDDDNNEGEHSGA